MPEQTEQKFTNVVIYRTGGFGVSRTHCKDLTVTTGQKYAQYDDAVLVKYTEVRKRKPAGFYLTFQPWMRVVAVEHAISPDESLVPVSDEGTVKTSRSRYSSCDPRWQTDFEDLLAARGTPVLLAIGTGEREGAFLERMKATDR